MEQKVIPNQGIGRTNAVCDILGLQSDDFSCQNLASSKKEEQRKMPIDLEDRKRRMKDSIKRRLLKIFRRIKNNTSKTTRLKVHVLLAL